MTYNNSDILPNEFFLSEVLGAKITLNGTKIGKLSDFVIVETGKLPEVTHLYVIRQFGKPALLLPVNLVTAWGVKNINISETDLTKYLYEYSDDLVLLKDYILDKKFLMLRTEKLKWFMILNFVLSVINFM